MNLLTSAQKTSLNAAMAANGLASTEPNACSVAFNVPTTISNPVTTQPTIYFPVPKGDIDGYLSFNVLSADFVFSGTTWTLGTFLISVIEDLSQNKNTALNKLAWNFYRQLTDASTTTFWMTDAATAAEFQGLLESFPFLTSTQITAMMAFGSSLDPTWTATIPGPSLFATTLPGFSVNYQGINYTTCFPALIVEARS